MSGIRYLIVHKDYPITVDGVNSGAETATLWLARALAARGHQVTVAAMLRGEECSRDGVEFWQLGESYDTAAALRRASASGPYYLFAACRGQVLTESREDNNCRARVLVAHDPSGTAIGVGPQIVSRYVDAIVCVSAAQSKLLLENGADPKKVQVIKNGADLATFRVLPDVQRNVKRIVYAGALVIDKGVDILIRAFNAIKARHPDAILDIYGSAAMWGRGELFDWNEVMKSSPGVTVHGSKPQAEVARAFAGAGLCVIPSRWFDSFPLAAVEAQACGCPVVAFNVGGIAESLHDGETGVLVPEVNEQRLAETLDRLLSNPGEIERMSRNAADLAAREFAWDGIAARFEAIVSGQAGTGAKPQGRIGFVSTWNQQCGLATYGHYLVDELPKDSFVVYGEIIDGPTTRPDETYVRRVWKRASTDFSALEAALTRDDVRLLHLNIHHSFFPQPAFGDFVRQVRKRGVIVVAHLHSVFTVEAALQNLVQSVDRVIVHSPESRLEAIANGALPDQVFVLPHGVNVRPVRSTEARSELRARLGIAPSERVVVSFGFIQPHKGMEGVIEAVHRLKSRGQNARGFILGRPMAQDPNSGPYVGELRALAERAGIAAAITFDERFLSDGEVADYLEAADLVLMNYRSQYFEASGACALALGAHALVATSIAPAFMGFGDAVWHLTTGYPPALAAELLLSNGALVGAVRAAAAQYCAAHAWPRVTQKLMQWYRNSLQFVPTTCAPVQAVEPILKEQGKTMATQHSNRTPIRVLMQNRPNVLTQRGGDTVVMERLVAGLERRGITVVVDPEGREDPSTFDLVHLFNFALPDLLKAQAERAVRANRPYVVTTLYEDIPSFRNQGMAQAQWLIEYVERGQDKQWASTHPLELGKIPPSRGFDNTWVAEHAAALFSNGDRESSTLQRDYPKARRIVSLPLGSEVSTVVANPQLFEQQYGVRDFILCVGRTEWRKNQLMLLKALEDSELPVVIAGGGFSYDGEYDRAVRNFKRIGKTIVVDRLSPEMLASMYAAAKIHVLPSWYELPGLVSLEAAVYGKNVVATDRGTTRDYLGNDGFYCEPGDPSSVLNAVMAAYYSPNRPGLKVRATNYRWDDFAERTAAEYATLVAATKTVEQAVAAPIVVPNATAILNPKLVARAPQGAAAPGGFDAAPEVTEIQDLIDRGELLANEGKFKEAQQSYERAEASGNQSLRLIRGRGAVYLAEGKVTDAKRYFIRANEIDATDAKAMCGLGMCEMRGNRYEAAYPWFVKAIERTPTHGVTLMQLIECAYTLGRYEDLERALRRFVADNPGDVEMRFCLAGCLYKQGKCGEATLLNDALLADRAGHKGALDLKRLLVAVQAKGTPSPIAPPVQTVAPLTSKITTEFVAPPAPVTPVVGETGRSDVAGLRMLEDLEEQKRQRNYTAVRQGCIDLLNRYKLFGADLDRAQLLRAEAHVLGGELAEARALYEQVLARGPKHPRALCGRGALAAHGGDWVSAREFFEQALKAQPRYDVALAGLGMCATWSKDPEGAWNYYHQACQANPENSRALLGLMEVGYPKARYQEIESCIRAYLDMHPADLEFVYSLAGCCFAQNKLTEARNEVERVILFDPAHQRAGELRQKIAEKMQWGGAVAQG